MKQEEFEQLVVEGFEKLPQWVKEKIRNVALLVEEEPSQELRRREGLGQGETLLGYYHGVPLSERGDVYGIGGNVLPDTITIFQNPILEEAWHECYPDGHSHAKPPLADEKYKECVRKVVAETVWHEFAHHFGMDEHEVRLREDKRKN